MSQLPRIVIINIVASCLSEGAIMDHGQLACLCLLARLLQGELEKCLRLVISLPMADMDKYFGQY